MKGRETPAGKRPLLLIVGEAPGREEDAAGVPFVGRSGSQLETALQGLGVVASEVWMTNAARCRPTNNLTPDDKKIKLCREFLWPEIQRANPRVIVALGNSALYALVGLKNITLNRLKTFDFALDGGSWKVFPTFHPAYLDREENYGGEKTMQFLADLDRAIGFARSGKFTEPKKRDYRVVRTDADLQVMFSEIRRADKVAWDIETTGLDPLDPRAAVTTIQFSTRTHSGWLVPLRHNSRWVSGEIPWIESPRPESISRSRAQELLREDAEKFGPVTVPLQKCLDWCRGILEGTGHPPLYGQNLKFDVNYVEKVLGWKPRLPFFDCRVGLHLLDEEGAQSQAGSLKNMAWRYTDLGGFEDEAEMRHPGFIQRTAEIPLEDFKLYGCPDTDVVLRVAEKTLPEIEAQGLLEVMAREMECQDFVKQMQAEGIRVDWERLTTLQDLFPRELERLVLDLRSYPEVQEAEVLHAKKKTKEDAQKHGDGAKKDRKPVEFNPGSTEQRRTLLLDHLKLPSYLLTKTGQPSTDKLCRQFWRSQVEAQSSAYEALSRIDEFLKLDKLNSGYVQGLSKHRQLDGRVRSEWSMTTTTTWRFACSKPNLQQLPRVAQNLPGAVVGAGDIKALFVAPYPGWLLAEIDFNQAEMRLAGTISGDPFIRKCYAQGIDMHADAAAKVFGVPYSSIGKEDDRRQQAKSANFGALYLIGARSLAMNQGIREEEAQRFLKVVWKNFRGYKRWVEETKRFVLENGYTLSPLGHRRRPSGLNSRDEAKRAGALRQAVNFPIQSAASKLTIYAGMWANQLFLGEGADARVIGQVHDSLWVAFPEWETEYAVSTVLDIMENLPFDFLYAEDAIPMKADAKVGPNLRDMKKWERPQGR